jgi:hypothetical protein
LYFQALVGEPGAEKVMAKIFKIPIDVLVSALGKPALTNCRAKFSREFSLMISSA